MRFHYNTTPDETIDYLRYQAIDAKQPPAVIDALDALRDLLEAPAELEKLGEELGGAENDRDDLHEELEQCTDALEKAVDIIASIDKNPADKPTDFFDQDELQSLLLALKTAKQAWERHNA